MSTPALENPAAKTAAKTAYHILRRVPPSAATADPTVNTEQRLYELVYQGLDAPSADTAIRYFATGKPDGKHDKAIEGSYIAIPSRSFVEKTVKVETTTTVKLG